MIDVAIAILLGFIFGNITGFLAACFAVAADRHGRDGK